MKKSTKIEFIGKDIVLVDKDLNYATHTVESVLSKKLSFWKGWSCSIGLQHLYVDYDGNVFRGTCRQGGIVGNVYAAQNFDAGSQWIVCGKQICSCGADMAAAKVKNPEDVDKFFDKGKVKEFNLLEGSAIVPNMVFSTNQYYKNITWAIGRRCNFDCWYCPESDHNNFEEHKSYDTLMSAYSVLNSNWIKDAPTKFSLLGGELTVYKDYLPFVKTLRELGHRSITTTNGTRDPDYHASLAEVSDICFSLHLKYVKSLGIEKFIKNIESAVKHKHDNFIRVRLMADPGNLEYAQEVYGILLENFHNKCLIAVKPVHDSNGKLFASYKPKEIFWIQKPH